MINQTFHKRTTRRFLGAVAAGSVLMGTAIGYAGHSRADSGLTRYQASYVVTYGPSAICPAIDLNHTTTGVIAVTKAVMADGFTADESVEIVNIAVANYCNRNWALIEQTGDVFRSADRGQLI